MATDFQSVDAGTALTYENYTVQIMKPFVAAVLKLADPKSEESLLDVACGTGIVARTAAANVPRLQAVGVDLSPNMLEIARQNDSMVTWEQASADLLPFAGGTFDVITCQQGLQFFPDPGAATMEMERVLALDGRAVATVWAPLEKNPYFQTYYDALRTYLGEEETSGGSTAIPEDGDVLLKEAFIEGGFGQIEMTTVEATVDLPDVAQWAREHIVGTPIGSQFSKLSDADKEAFGEHFVDALAPYIRDDNVAAVPFASWIAIGRKL